MNPEPTFLLHHTRDQTNNPERVYMESDDAQLIKKKNELYRTTKIIFVVKSC